MGFHQNFMAKLPQIAAQPDLVRGEQRLAAEVSLAQLRGELVPTWVVERANETLKAMARG